MCVPRRTSRQTHRSNILLEARTWGLLQSNCVHSVRRQLFTAAKGASDRTDQKILLQSFKCLIPAASADKPTEIDEQDLRQLYKMYADVLHCSELSAVGELRLWYSCVRDIAPKNAREAQPDHISCNSQSTPHSCYAACYYSIQWTIVLHAASTQNIPPQHDIRRQTQRFSSAIQVHRDLPFSGGNAGRTGEKVSLSRNSLVTVALYSATVLRVLSSSSITNSL